MSREKTNIEFLHSWEKKKTLNLGLKLCFWRISPFFFFKCVHLFDFPQNISAVVFLFSESDE